MRPRRPHGGAGRARPRRARARRRAARAAAGASSSRARRPTPPAPSSSPAASSRAIAPAAVVAAHVHPELPLGTGRAGRGRGQRLLRRRRDHGRGRAHARRLSAPRDAIRSWRSRRSWSRSTPQVGRRIDPLRPGLADDRGARGRQRGERDPGAEHAARGALRAHRPRGPRSRCARWSRRSPAGSPRPTAAAPRSSSCPASPRSRTTPAIVARARELLPSAGLAAAGSGARAAPTTSPSSARSPRWRWRSWGSTERRASRRARCTIPSCLPPDAGVGAVARAQAVLYVAAVVSSAGAPSLGASA